MKRPDLVAFGTSLGGLKALSAVLGTLPATFSLPIVVVQHRGIGGGGQSLATLLQDYTRLTVQEAEDKMTLEAGSVYLAPADYHLMVESPGMLALSTDTPVRSARPSIDVLFETAADAYGEALLAVLLTGASADGAQGVTAVKARGGRVIVQDPATAESSAMPAAGIAATDVDFVVPLEDIGSYVTSLAEGTRQ
jgi:two-component system, chemotaxis family, protein-glutamate methylesterase/glutaminase